MKKLAVVFGRMSTEHDISVVSAMSIMKNLDKNKYEIYPIYIDKSGEWFTYNFNLGEVDKIKLGDKVNNIRIIENPLKYLKQMNCVFPVLHGLYGEDGTIQGLLELLKIKYVGCKVLSSSIAMDKAYTKMIFEKIGLEQAKYIYIKCRYNKFFYIDNELNEQEKTIEEIEKIVKQNLKYPVFVKPSNSGSSVGISKVINSNKLKDAIKLASKYDEKILIEEGIKAREVECSVLESKGNIIVSCVGEIKSAEDFYSFDSKYKNEKSQTQIPADIEESIAHEIQRQAKKAFQAVDGRGLSRVDFFIEEDTNKIYINEINTMPGFTQISMYPKLFEKIGISYSELLDELIGGEN